METVIKATLALAIRLVDTTNAKGVDAVDVRFYRNGSFVRPMYRGDATWIFVGPDREDHTLRVDAVGYESTDWAISYEKLDPQLPMCEIFLIPSEKNRKGEQVVGIEGTLPGMEAIDAVILAQPICMFRGCTERKGVVSMNLFPAAAGAKAMLAEGSYVILAEDGKSYEEFQVVRQVPPATVILKAGLSRTYRADSRIYRLIYGRADPDGNFILRGRDGGRELPLLVRYRVEGVNYFRDLDLSKEQGRVDLTEGAREEVLPETGKEDKADE